MWESCKGTLPLLCLLPSRPLAITELDEGGDDGSNNPLIWEDPTCCGAIKPVCHNNWACVLAPGSHNYWAHVPQLLKPVRPRACARQQEKPPRWEAWAQLENVPHSLWVEKSRHSNKDPAQPKIKKNKIMHKKRVNPSKLRALGNDDVSMQIQPWLK